MPGHRATDTVAVIAAAAGLVLAGLAACSSTRPASCSWYTTVSAGGVYRGQVIVAAAGPACSSSALVEWVADRTGRAWTSTTLRPAGTELAELDRAGSTVTVWIAGPRADVGPVAGYLADDLEAAGWAPAIP